MRITIPPASHARKSRPPAHPIKPCKSPRSPYESHDANSASKKIDLAPVLGSNPAALTEISPSSLQLSWLYGAALFGWNGQPRVDQGRSVGLQPYVECLASLPSNPERVQKAHQIERTRGKQQRARLSDSGFNDRLLAFRSATKIITLCGCLRG